MTVMICVVSFVSLAILVYLVMAERATLKGPEVQPNEQPMPQKEWRRFNPVHFG